ncbi:MAG: copper chaperone PCu(A)C [Pseudomonadota bacterium]
MKAFFPKVFFSLVLVAASTLAHAALVVEGGHVRALLPGVNSTAAYMTLRNGGTAELVLTAISSPSATKVTLHNTMNHNGMLHMMSMETLRIPAGGEVVFEAGGMHLMLEELSAGLEPGDEVELVLQFATGENQTITLPVRSVLDE